MAQPIVIQRELIGEPVDELTLNLALGPIKVNFGADGVIWMRQNPPRFGHNFSHADMARVLNVAEDDIDSRYPVQEVSTGLPFALVPMASLEALQRAWVNLDRLRALLGAHEAIGPAIFCRETLRGENDLHARVLDDIYAAPEDPATGSAAGCIAAYCLEHGYVAGERLSLRAEQGYQIGRPSLLRMEAWREADEIAIRVGGQVELVAQGQLASD